MSNANFKYNEHLKFLRKKHNLTAKSLAFMLGVKLRTVQHWDAKTRKCNYTAYLLALYLLGEPHNKKTVQIEKTDSMHDFLNENMRKVMFKIKHEQLDDFLKFLLLHNKITMTLAVKQCHRLRKHKYGDWVFIDF